MEPQVPAPPPRGPLLRDVSSGMGGPGPGGMGVGALARCGDPFHRSIFITFTCLIAFRDPLIFIA